MSAQFGGQSKISWVGGVVVGDFDQGFQFNTGIGLAVNEMTFAQF